MPHHFLPEFAGTWKPSIAQHPPLKRIFSLGEDGIRAKTGMRDSHISPRLGASGRI
jgi:hypothetical protein